MKRTLFITGTDTGAGKTVLAELLTRFLRGRGVRIAAFKPVCSGGRADARALHAALGGTLTLDEVNPWHFRAALAPLLAARLEKKSVTLAQVLGHIRKKGTRFDVMVVEGAGGLLSPIGKDFDSRDLILGLRAEPVIVAQNRLGMVNHLLLTLEALPKNCQVKTKIVLMSPAKADTAVRTNAGLLAEFFPRKKILTLPWLGKQVVLEEVVKNSGVRKVLSDLV